MYVRPSPFNIWAIYRHYDVGLDGVTRKYILVYSVGYTERYRPETLYIGKNPVIFINLLINHTKTDCP